VLTERGGDIQRRRNAPHRRVVGLIRLTGAPLHPALLSSPGHRRVDPTIAGSGVAQLSETRAEPADQPQAAAPRIAAGTRTRLPAILLAGLLVRLALAPFGSFQYDAEVMRSWATQLVAEPLASFYAAPLRVDHLPGDLWILWAVAHLYRLFSPAMQLQEPGFLYLLKLVPALADVGIGAMLYLLGRRFGGPRAGLLAAALFLFNPASLFLTSIWGQWDSVSALVVLIALWLLLRGQFEWSLPVLTYAALIKPPFAALAPLFGLAFLLEQILPLTRRARPAAGQAPVEPLRRALRRAGIAVLSSLAVALAVLLPFGVGMPPLPTRWSLVERLSYAASIYKVSSVNAFTLWATIVGMREPDDQVFLFGLTYYTWGTLLFVVAYLAILLLYWRRNDRWALLWACLAIPFSLFMLPTRVHERYLFPAIVFAALLAAIAPRLRWLFAALSATYLVNLYYVYDLYYDALELRFLYSTNAVVILTSLLNVALLLYVLIRALRAVRGAQPRVPAATDGV
jgi:dolichyl-phosphate-mannose-protein mannosyltransferase